MYCGAIYGQGEGLQGNSYAIPTKGYGNPLPVRSLDEIKNSVQRFLDFAAQNCGESGLQFYVTPIGCGLAGYKYDQIAPMFANHTSNVHLCKEFKECLDS